MTDRQALRIAVIGAGPGGIATGRELLQQGFENFTIFEKSDAAGGTWHLQTYPGLACDVWAHSYTYSYEPNPDWSASFVEQPEIEAYLQRCATKFGLDSHIRFNTAIVKAQYHDSGEWQLHSDSGEVFEFDVVISAMGNQHTAQYPDVPGIETFNGDSWHSTAWNHDISLAGKRVAVVGSAASAVQIVPEVAKVAGQLSVLQRSPNWIMARGRKPYSQSKRARFARFPVLMRMLRKGQKFLMSFVYQATTLGHKRMDDFEKTARKFLEKSVADPQLRKVLTPDSHWGCKRGLVSDDFYPALQRDNVELIPSGVREITPGGLITSDGRELQLDVILYCTGYKILDYDRIEVIGKNGQSLAAAMGDKPQAHKGIAKPGFPNYFFVIGPNGLVLNVSYFISAELNVKSIVGLLAEKQDQGVKAIEVKAEASKSYNDWLASQFERYSWGAPSCNSYYRNAAGHPPFLFAGDFKTYKQFHQQLGLHEYDIS
jgi:cyclohexanone monooxygenase